MEQPHHIDPLPPDQPFKLVVVGYKPTVDDGVENGSTVLFDGPASRNFQALIPGGYAVPIKLLSNIRETLRSKLMFGSGVQDEEAGRLVYEYLTAQLENNDEHIRDCVSLDVTFDGVQFMDGKIQTVMSTTADGLLKIIHTWRNAGKAPFVYEIGEVLISSDKAFVEFLAGPVTSWMAEKTSTVFDVGRAANGERMITKIVNIVPGYNGTGIVGIATADIFGCAKN